MPAERWCTGTRIVALTGWSQSAERKRIELAAFDTHLLKPVEPQLLLQLVIKWFGSAGGEAA